MDRFTDELFDDEYYRLQDELDDIMTKIQHMRRMLEELEVECAKKATRIEGVFLKNMRYERKLYMLQGLKRRGRMFL